MKLINNKCSFIGNLTRDPELRYTPNATAVLKFSLGVNNPFKEGEVVFPEFEAWEKQAEVIAKFARKGKEMSVDSEMKVDTWEKDGEKRSKVVFRVRDFKFHGAKADAEQGGGEAPATAEEPPKAVKPKVKKPVAAFDDDDDDDVQF